MSVLESLIKAINNQLVIEFEYHKEGKAQGKRIGHPYAIFIHTSTVGHLSVKVHILQTEGVSDSKEIHPLPDFRMFNLEEIEELVLTEEHFLPSSPKYNAQWEGYSETIAQVTPTPSRQVIEIVNNQFIRLYANTGTSDEGQLYHFYALNKDDQPLFNIRLSLMEVRTLFEYLYSQSSIRNHQHNYLQRDELPISFRILLEQMESHQPDAITVLLQYYNSHQRIETLQQILSTSEVETLYRKRQFHSRRAHLQHLCTVIHDRSFRATNFTSWLSQNSWALGQYYVHIHSVSKYDKLPLTSLLFETADHWIECVLIYDTDQALLFSNIIGESVQAVAYLQQEFPSHFIRVKCIIPDNSLSEDSLLAVNQQIPTIFFLRYSQVQLIAQRMLAVDE